MAPVTFEACETAIEPSARTDGPAYVVGIDTPPAVAGNVRQRDVAPIAQGRQGPQHRIVLGAAVVTT